MQSMPLQKGPNDKNYHNIPLNVENSPQPPMQDRSNAADYKSHKTDSRTLRGIFLKFHDLYL